MKLEDYIYKSLLEYPSLYLCNNYEDSKMLVLNHLFLVNGNGMDWAISKGGNHEGYLVEDKYKKTKDDEWIRLPDKPYGKPVIKNKLSFIELLEKYKNEYLEDSKYKSIREFNARIPERIKILIREQKLKDMENGNYLQKFEEHTPYPFASEYWPYAEIDINLIKPDWREGMLQCFEWALNFYTDKETNKTYVLKYGNYIGNQKELENARNVLLAG